MNKYCRNLFEAHKVLEATYADEKAEEARELAEKSRDLYLED